MPPVRMLVPAVLALSSALASGQMISVFDDLAPLNPRTLSKDELKQLLPGARMTRTSPRGNVHTWTNEADGRFTARSDNRAISGRGASSTAEGTWRIADDGRYCVTIEWQQGLDTEKWCRFIVATGDGYYAVKTTGIGSEPVQKLGIEKK